MHNGNVEGFLGFRRQVLASLSDERFQFIRGTTDSETVFALFLDAYAEASNGSATERLASALKHAVAKICQFADDAGVTGSTFLNLAVSDGENAVTCRYVHRGDVAHSLFYQTGKRYFCDDDGICHLLDSGDGRTATLVASEPLAEGAKWAEVPQNHLLLLPGAGDVELLAF